MNQRQPPLEESLSAVVTNSTAWDNLTQIRRYALARQELGKFASFEAEEAWREFYDFWNDWIRRLVVKHVHPLDVDDLVQTVWLKLWKELIRPHDVDPKRAQAWLAAITRNALLDSLRRGQRERRRCCGDLASFEEVEDRRALEVNVDEQDELDCAMNMLRPHLSNETFEIVRQRLVERMTPEKIAQRVGLSLDQTNSRLHRGYEKLRMVLSQTKANNEKF